MDKAKLLAHILRAGEAGEMVELVIVVDTQGSSPRSAGAWMAVFPDGSSQGTVGGGAVEMLAIREAKRLLDSRSSRVANVGMDGKSSETGMVCGGAVTLAYLYIDERTLPTLARAQEMIARREDAVLVVDMSSLPDGGEATGAVASFAIEPFEEGVSSRAALMRGSRYEEPLCPEGYVYVFGCGHVGRSTACALAAAGFSVIACDDRPSLLDPALLSGVAERRVVDYANLAATCAPTERDMVVTATSGHRFDLTVLKQMLPCRPTYLGCLASKKKAAYVRKELIAEGFSAELVDAIHMPIGLPIFSETPEEIAVSIVAEMIVHRRTHLMPVLKA